MGPQLLRCGNSRQSQYVEEKAPGFNGAATFVLQKCVYTCISYLAQFCFNGAATFVLRKCVYTCISYLAQFCFNGAATFVLRKLPWDHNTHLPPRSFNGAATFVLRKFTTISIRGREGTGLQWGRNFCVAEINIGEKTMITPDMLQWGRNFCVAEIVTEHHVY